MKTYKNLYPKLCSYKNLELAFKKASKGKNKKPYIIEFTKAIPKKNPISLRFFYFEEGQRVWQDIFLMAEGEVLISGKAAIYLTLHSKYIEQIDELGLCDTIKTANENRDLGFESEYSKASLLVKYSGLLKYRECIGI